MYRQTGAYCGQQSHYSIVRSMRLKSNHSHAQKNIKTTDPYLTVSTTSLQRWKTSVYGCSYSENGVRTPSPELSDSWKVREPAKLHSGYLSAPVTPLSSDCVTNLRNKQRKKSKSPPQLFKERITLSTG